MRQHTVLQYHDRPRDDGWPFWSDHPGPGAGGASRVPTPPAGIARDPADGYATLCGLVDGDYCDYRWLELLTSARPGATHRTSVAHAVSIAITGASVPVSAPIV